MGLAAADGSAVPIAAMPPIAAGLLDLGTPAAGELFVQGRVDVGAGPQRFDDVFGAGWRLVTDGAAAVPEELAAWFTSIGGRIVGVGDGADATDVDGTYRQWFDAQGVASAVQRPDFAVFASGDPTTVLADLRRRL